MCNLFCLLCIVGVLIWIIILNIICFCWNFAFLEKRVDNVSDSIEFNR